MHFDINVILYQLTGGISVWGRVFGFERDAPAKRCFVPRMQV
jgi:hypothetical protein